MKNNFTVQRTFTMLKPESYLFNKADFIMTRVTDSGLDIVAQEVICLSFKDVFDMYPGWKARLTICARFPPLFQVDVIYLEGVCAIRRMNNLKHQIRNEIWGREYKKGGYLHAPDSVAESQLHMDIIAKRIVRKPCLIND